MSSSAISVVIPVYGVERYIENCIRSVLAQTFRDFEVLLVDDGCRDRSIPLAVALLENGDIPFRVIHQENQGQGPARDHGMREARGEYVICVDSDDTVSPVFLEELYAAARAHRADVAFCLFQMVDEEGIFRFNRQRGVYQTISRPDMLHRFLCRTLVPILPTMLMRRELLLRYGISTAQGCRFSEDVYLMWLVFSRAETITYTSAPLYNYLRRENSTMTASTAERILSGYAAFCELAADARFAPDFPEAGFLLPRWVLGALNSSARICDYETFINIAKHMDYRVHMKRLRRFPERKARVLAGLLLCAPRVYYRLLHRE